jgi:hypothetical protein
MSQPLWINRHVPTTASDTVDCPNWRGVQALRDGGPRRETASLERNAFVTVSDTEDCP